MLGHGGSSAGSHLADPTFPIPSHCAVIILFQSVPVHQLSRLALKELNFLSQRNSRGMENPCDALKFRTEERIQCTQSNKVKYTSRTDFLLALPVPLEAAVNEAEVTAWQEKKARLEAEKKHP